MAFGRSSNAAIVIFAGQSIAAKNAGLFAFRRNGDSRGEISLRRRGGCNGSRRGGKCDKRGGIGVRVLTSEFGCRSGVG